METGQVNLDHLSGHLPVTSVDTFLGRFVSAFVGSPCRAEITEKQPSWVLFWALLWALFRAHLWAHSWGRISLSLALFFPTICHPGRNYTLVTQKKETRSVSVGRPQRSPTFGPPKQSCHGKFRKIGNSWAETFLWFVPQVAASRKFKPCLEYSGNCVHPGNYLRNNYRAARKGTNLRGQTPICGFLLVPAKICGFPRKSAVSCQNLRFPNALFSRKRWESARIIGNLRLGSVCPLRFVPIKCALIIIRKWKCECECKCNFRLSRSKLIEGACNHFGPHGKLTGEELGT